jgi:very-short-patch-repair endonuclease
MRPQPHVDREIRRLAEAQHGVVARRQLLELGLGAEAIKWRRRTGRLVPLHRGVYALGHRALRDEGRWMAAVLACGRGAVLSHRSAARVHGIRPWSGRVEVTVAGQGGCRRSSGGARSRPLVHRSADLPGDDVMVVEGLPVTTVPRTLLDLAAIVPAHHLRRAVERAEQLEVFDLAAVDRVLDGHPGRPGSAALRALLIDMHRHGVTWTRSDAEAAMLQVCIDHGLPRPLVNRHDGGREVDFRWPAHGLIVEIDGWTYHSSRRAFASDRARDRLALREGQRVARFTADEVRRTPAAVADDLRALLS